MDIREHFAVVVTYVGIWVCGTVTEQLSDCLCFFLGVVGSCKIAYGNDCGAVSGLPII